MTVLLNKSQVLLHGEAFSGKTALMAHTAVTSGFPFIRKIAADEMIGMGEVRGEKNANCIFVCSMYACGARPRDTPIKDPVRPRWESRVMMPVLATV